MGGKAKSDSSNVTTTSTFNATDSFKQSLNRVNNLSDVGNVDIDLSSDKGGTGNLVLAAMGIGAIVFLMIMRKKS